MYTFDILRTPVVYTGKYHAYHFGVNSKFQGFSQRDGIITLGYNAPLTESEQAAIQLADVSFVDNDPFDHIKRNILTPARAFGESLIDDFAAENILLGITQLNLTNHVRKTLFQVTDALRSGSLYDAIHEARQVPAEAKDAVIITNARLLAFINKIEKYLNIPMSGSL